MSLDVAVALWTLGILPVTEMRALARHALASGEDTIALRRLAALSDSKMSVEGPELFRMAFCAASDDSLSRTDAAKIVVKSVARSIAHGEMRPYDGAREIWRVALAAGEDNFQDADPFIYAASEYEERPSEREHFAEEILREAKRWIEK